MIIGKGLHSGRFIGLWRAVLFIVALFILGMPLDGSIPTPAGSFRESKEITSSVEAIGNRAVTAIVWGGMYFLALLTIAISPKPSIKAIKSQLGFLWLLALVFISALWSPYPEQNIFDGFQLIGAFAVCLVAAQHYKNNIPLLFKHATLALGVNLFINLLTVFALPNMTMDPNGRWAGVTGSANYLGALSFCCIWASLAWLAQGGVNRKWLPLFILAVAVIDIIGSNSVTSILSSLVVLVFFIHMYCSRPSKWRLVKSITFYFLAVASFLIIIFTGVDYWFNLMGRETSATGRNIIWLGAIDLIQAKPLLGHGFSSNTESLGVLHWATTFHNGYLDIGVKLGLIGLILFIYTVVQFFRALSVRQQYLSTGKAIGIFVVAYLFYNLAEATILAARNPTWLIFMTVIFTVGLQIDRPKLNNAT